MSLDRKQASVVLVDSPGGGLWDIDDLAAYLKIPKPTIYEWRKKGYGPPAIRLGKRLRYDPIAVREWLASVNEAA